MRAATGNHQENACLRGTAARHEMWILEPRLAVGQIGAGERRDAPARRDYDRMAGGGIPFHGAAEPRIEIGDAFRDEAELERATGRAMTTDPLLLQKGVHCLGVSMRTARQHDDAISG